MLNFLPLDTASATAAAGTSSGVAGSTASTWLAILPQFLIIAVMIVVFYFLLIRPQKKKDKEIQKMRDSLQVGDEVVTAGGIIGRVVTVKEDTVLIETGSDRSKVRVKRWAISSNLTVHDDTAEA